MAATADLTPIRSTGLACCTLTASPFSISVSRAALTDSQVASTVALVAEAVAPMANTSLSVTLARVSPPTAVTV